MIITGLKNIIDSLGGVYEGEDSFGTDRNITEELESWGLVPNKDFEVQGGGNWFQTFALTPEAEGIICEVLGRE